VFLYLIRHGHPVDAAGRIVGHTDLALADEGRRAAAALADSWPEPPTRVVASDLARTRDTAAVLAARWGREVEYDARLREMHFGAWDGRRIDALRAEDGERFGAWSAAWSTTGVPEGESFRDVAARVAEWWRDERARLAADDRLAVVAHAGSLRALLCHLLALPLGRAFDLRIDYARVSGVHVTDARTELSFLNADRVPR
jgi:broad specificity phosphatase PhoE